MPAQAFIIAPHGASSFLQNESDMNATDRLDIDLFLRNVTMLMGSRLFETEQIVETSLSFDMRTNRASMTSTTPNAPDTIAMLATLRKFTLEGGGSNLFHIFRICERALPTGRYRQEVRDLRVTWKAQGKTGQIKIVVDESTYAPEELFDCVINGLIFHDDQKKLARLRSLVGPSGPLAVHSFMGYIFDTVGVIAKVAHIIRVALADGSLR